MGGQIDEKDYERELKTKEDAEKYRLQNIESAAKYFLNNPSKGNKELLRRAIYPPNKDKSTRNWFDTKSEPRDKRIRK
jgi:hypothetical protein